MPYAENSLRQLCAPRADQPRETQYLATADAERDVLEQTINGEMRDIQSHFRIGSGKPFFREHLGRAAPDHASSQFRLVQSVTAADVIALFKELNEFLRRAGIKKVIYRPIPWIYHRHPSEEDLYAIFWQCRARLHSRNIGTTICMNQQLAWRKDHRRRLKQAEQQCVKVVKNGSIEEFWGILEENLRKKFNAKPVHTLEEMMLLKSKFPENIIQYNAYLGGQIIGGITFYLTPQVLHGQYSATNEAGKENGAMEAIYQRVMYEDFPSIPYLDFGSSTEQQGSQVNEGLIAHKEGYGGRAICYDTYEWNL